MICYGTSTTGLEFFKVTDGGAVICEIGADFYPNHFFAEVSETKLNRLLFNLQLCCLCRWEIQSSKVENQATL